MSQQNTKEEYEKELEDAYEEDLAADLLAVNLYHDIEKDVMAKPAGKMPILKTSNYYIWTHTHRKFFKGRVTFDIVTRDMARPLMGCGDDAELSTARR